jgi:long-chain acyl-CoA synthetase
MPEVKSPLKKFSEHVARKPNATFLKQPFNGKWYEYSWKETDDQVRRMAAYLQSLGLEPGSKVAIISKNCAHWIMSDLAIMMAGHVSVPLYPTVGADTIRYVIEHSESKVCFVGKLDDWSKQRPGMPENVHCISFPFWTEPGYDTWDDIMKKTEPLKGDIDRDPKDLCTIIYTSGTTGVPKGVMQNFHSFSFAPTYALGELSGLVDDERFFSYLPLSHIAERMLVELGGLYTGGTISFAESLDSFAENLKFVKPTIFLAVPRIWTKFQMGIISKMPEKRLNLLLSIPIINNLIKKKIKEGLGLDQAKYVLTGAAPLPVATMKWFEKLDIKICEAYAMTENSAYSHLTRLENRRPGYVGQALPKLEIRLSEQGEIQTRSECNMLGYYKDEEKTRETLTKDGFLCTGDKGFIDKDGFLKITGRVKDIFKTDKGKYVAPAPIELELSKNTHIEQVCVIGANLPQTMALVVLSPEAKKLPKEELSASLEQTMKEVNQSFDKHERMKKMVVMNEEWTVDNNLLTPTLKVKRNVLEEKYQDDYPKWYQAGETVVWL